MTYPVDTHLCQHFSSGNTAHYELLSSFDVEMNSRHFSNCTLILGIRSRITVRIEIKNKCFEKNHSTLYENNLSHSIHSTPTYTSNTCLEHNDRRNVPMFADTTSRPAHDILTAARTLCTRAEHTHVNDAFVCMRVLLQRSSYIYIYKACSYVKINDQMFVQTVKCMRAAEVCGIAK